MKAMPHFVLIVLLGTFVSCTDGNRNVQDSGKKYPFNDPSISMDERVGNILELLTLEEKAGFLSGESMWHLHGVERLGIPEIQVTDCGHGVTVILDENGNYSGCATCFPTAVAQGASWDCELVRRIGAALGRETRALGSSILLAPMVNIHRLPIGGRNYETFSEDPFLTGKLAASFITGVQSEHIGSVIKAITAYNQQKESRSMARVSERALREIYLPAFRMAIKDANPWGVMTAYNGVNEHPTTESRHLLSEIVKTEWKYEGFIVSDWRAVISSKSITAGVDIEMPGPGKFMDTDDILKAIEDGLITEDEVNKRAGRYLRALVKSKLLDIPRPALNSASDTPNHHDLAREAAEGSIVLLKNKDGMLPLDKKDIKKIAVFGPNAEEARLGGGGSASVTACYTVSPLKGIRNHIGQSAEITFIEGAALTGNLPIVPGRYLTTVENGNTVNGLHGEYFDGPNLQGKPQCSRVDGKIDYSWGWAAPCDHVTKNGYSVRWTGKINAPESGVYEIGVTVNEGGVRLFLDNKLVLDEWGDPGNEITEARFVYKSKSVSFKMEKGSSHNIKVEFHKKHNKNAIRLEWKLPHVKSAIEDAVNLARESDVAIVFAGLSNLIEGGNNDKESLNLPGEQDKLISSIARVNPNTVVVLINGTPVTMPWIDEVKAVLEAYYPGQEGGNAIARVLLGEVNPSGKLPDTFPIKPGDCRAMQTYPGENGEMEYTEGIYVGYRQFEADHMTPLFPFGFGLSYTVFEFENLVVEKIGAQKVTVAVDISNTGKVAGAEVVQVYIRDIMSSIDRPIKELKGFDKIHLQPGETKRVTIELDEYAFSFYSEKQNEWIVEPGEFQILVGSSSQDIHLEQTITL